MLCLSISPVGQDGGPPEHCQGRLPMGAARWTSANASTQHPWSPRSGPPRCCGQAARVATEMVRL
eukprot:11692388-Alexandrium_andersonii.AAC.1